MVCCFPSTPKKLAMTMGCFLSGAALFVVGMHYSYVNVAPQQARIKARNDFVRDRLRKKYANPNHRSCFSAPLSPKEPLD